MLCTKVYCVREVSAKIKGHPIDLSSINKEDRARVSRPGGTVCSSALGQEACLRQARAPKFTDLPNLAGMRDATASEFE